MEVRAIAAALIGCLAAINPARAETDWARQLAGLDGVAIACVSSTGEKYAERICDRLTKSATQTLEKAGVPVASSGYHREGGPSPKLPEGMKPLEITIYLRGTPGGTAAILVRGRAAISYEAAVESGDEGTGRTGDLVIWEESTVGSGPVKQLEAAIANAMNDKLAGLLAHVADSWGR
ncbi:hypothetical protein ACKTEK_08100 [Tepidamorphus sp. 3E244]|uniref:hypothetical protein n=1 Tax=Tepidamorphus sp. 3E244 TaxID=3385498 RepID=UPI0038FCCAD9